MAKAAVFLACFHDELGTARKGDNMVELGLRTPSPATRPTVEKSQYFSRFVLGRVLALRRRETRLSADTLNKFIPSLSTIPLR
jgi:hypothetical protein